MAEKHKSPLAPAFLLIDHTNTHQIWQAKLERAAAQYCWTGEFEFRHLHDALDFDAWGNQCMADVWRTALRGDRASLLGYHQGGNQEIDYEGVFCDAMSEALLRLQGAIRNQRFAEMAPQHTRLLAVVVTGEHPLDLFVGAAGPYWDGESLIFWTGPERAINSRTLESRPGEFVRPPPDQATQRIVEILHSQAMRAPPERILTSGRSDYWI
jgi:hypothetical protein